MNVIDELRDDLWGRWRKHFHDPTLREVPGPARVAYSRKALFDLKNWTPSTFPPGGRLSAEPIAGSNNWVYHLDGQGRPQGMSLRHTVNRVDWRGVYRYAPEEVEYVEICLNSNVPSQYDRVTVRDQQPATLQRLWKNTGGRFPAWSAMGRNDLLEKITSDPRNFQIWIESYEAEDGLIRRGRAYIEGLGVPPRHSSLSFSYSAGKLQRIVRRWEDGQEETVFAARTSVTLQDLSVNLSRRLADRIIDALKETTSDKAAPDCRLVAVELSYRAGDRYVPIVYPYTEADRIQSFPFLEGYTSDRGIELSAEHFEPEMAEFTERLRASERGDAGRDDAATAMLRAAASLVTRLTPESVPTAEGFLAYAIDWELEGDAFPKILKDCGADASALRIWRKRGWLS